ncbi:ABC transporter permease subunit [Paenibacillus sp. J5C_2022]|uniref:ABC transporter permease n=1 Tax=Paenibacillus sp. J5C2022 TaxID=2977129 RepID=UPI0021D1F11B|nr:ABC transporter permease subunit [Paenibacillus sp. J5C2022]MCU6709123.1 ABC transporter permease subunit [Paenibacillus sp. J5C2022]
MFVSRLKRTWPLYVLVLPAIVHFVIFQYVPMYGVQIAFKNYYVTKGIWGSEWIGFDHFERFFQSFYFWRLIRNTLLISLYQLALFPVSIIVALSLNELVNGWYKKTVQTVTYAPHFISVVVMNGMLIAFLSPSTGIINKFIEWLGFEAVSFMTEPVWFKSIFVLSGEWQNLGWGAIIYLAALVGINPELHEAARVDGATRLQRIWHINIPGIMPTIVILLILNVGNFMTIGFERIYLLQNSLNMEASDIIQTYVYRSGLLEGQYSFSSAVGLFNSVINLILLLSVNHIARKLNSTSLL